MKIKRFKIVKDYDKYRVIEESKTFFGSKESKIDYFYSLERAKELIDELKKGNGELYKTEWFEF